MTTLISFLGRSQLDVSSGYRRARYRFANGVEVETAFLGPEIARHIGAGRIILIGTPGSMWDHLVETVVGDAAEEDPRLELMEAVRAGRVTEELLRRLVPAFTRALGREVSPILTPPSVAFGEQQRLLERLSELIESRADVAVDVTHGFRHLSMLALSAIRYLAHVRSVRLGALYYGALEMAQDGVAPIIELTGLAHLQEWVEALATYKASGDFSRFAPLLARDGFPEQHLEALRAGWALLAVNNVHDASLRLRPVYGALDSPLSGASELFRARLRRELRWVEAGSLAEKLRLLARQALARRDLLRSAIFGIESFLAAQVTVVGGDPLDHQQRERVTERFRQELAEGRHPDWKRDAYWLLSNVRNAIVHGTRPTVPRHAELLRNQERLTEELDVALNRLLNTQ